VEHEQRRTKLKKMNGKKGAETELRINNRIEEHE
jgi:hypothetical protein